MASTGCYGSILAHDPNSDSCKSCPSFVECGAQFAERRPKLINVLDKFMDGQGRTMAWDWLNRQERKKRREQEKQEAMALAEELTLGTDATGLRAEMDPRAFTHFDKLMERRVDPRSADLDDIATASPAMNAVISALRTAPQTTDGLAAAIAFECGLSASTAMRDAQALTTLLTSCDRAQRDGPTVRLV